MNIVRTVMIGACLLVLAGCGQKSTETPTADKSVDADGRLTESGPASGLSVVTTLFPLYDFTRQIGGDKVACIYSCSWSTIFSRLSTISE